MRFDKPIFFQTITQGEYDKNTGNYKEDTVTEEKIYASVTDLGAETLNLVYGELKQGCFCVKLQRPYAKAFDRIRIGNKTYRVDLIKTKMRVFIVSEVQ